MGNTDFLGAFSLGRKLSHDERLYLLRLAGTRRMRRDEILAARFEDRLRLAVGLPIGDEAGYFVGGMGVQGQFLDPSVLDAHTPPAGQPSLWCHWVPSATGQFLGWNGCAGFDGHALWLNYLIEHFFGPWGVRVSGAVRWRGENANDWGTLVITNSLVKVMKRTRFGMSNCSVMRQRSCIYEGQIKA